jgi:hypothetical protein
MKELVDVEIVSAVNVEDATRLVRSVDVAIPLIVVVSVAPLVVRALDEITDDVAVTPLIVVVNVLPESDCVKELIIEVATEVIPLTIVSRIFADDDATFEVTIVDVAIDPPRFEVSILALAESVLEVLRLVIVADAEVKSVMVALDIVVVARDTVPVAVSAPVVSVVNVGVRDTLIVEVPERDILFPAVK